MSENTNKKYPSIPSCECIVQFEKYGITFPIKLFMPEDMSKIEDRYVLTGVLTTTSAKGKVTTKNHDCLMTHCPFCGRKLHMVTDETWAERTAAKEEV